MLSGCTALNDHQKDTEESILTAGDAAEIVGGETPPEVSPSEQELKKLYGSYYVKYVIDGDTFIADIDGTETKIRMIGVDTPESVSYDKNENTEEGMMAAEYTKQLLQDKEVWIEYDQVPLDRYGRALAYVYLDAYGTVMVQDILLVNGLANCMRIEPNTKYANRFAEIQEQARQNGIGFWEYDFWNE